MTQTLTLADIRNSIEIPRRQDEIARACPSPLLMLPRWIFDAGKEKNLLENGRLYLVQESDGSLTRDFSMFGDLADEFRQRWDKFHETYGLDMFGDTSASS